MEWLDARDVRHEVFIFELSIDKQRTAARAFDFEPRLAVQRDSALVSSMHSEFEPPDAVARRPGDDLAEHSGCDALGPVFSQYAERKESRVLEPVSLAPACCKKAYGLARHKSDKEQAIRSA